MQISTRYHTLNGAGRITAVVKTGEHKGRRKTVSYDHGARDPHAVAAQALCTTLGLDPAPLTYVGTHAGPGNSYCLPTA